MGSNGHSVHGARALRISAVLVLAGALLSGPGALLLVAAVAPQPEWTDVASFVQHYHPVQAVPYVFGFLLLFGFALFVGSCHAAAPAALRPRTSAALVFTAVYGALVFTNYTLQVGFVPRMLAAPPVYLGHLVMANPSSVAWFLEMFGYAALGIATWLVAPLFGDSARASIIRYLLIANGVLSLVGAACTALLDRWVFSSAGLWSFGAWNAVIAVCFLLIAISARGGLEERVPTRSPTTDSAA